MFTFDRIRAYHVRFPMTKPFRISVGEIREKECLLLECTAGGITGWGEAAVDAVPFYTAETVGSALDVSQRLFASLAKSQQWKDPWELADAFAEYHGNYFAKAAFDTAFWDIYGKAQGKSVAEILGGTRKRVEVGGGSIGIHDDLGQLVDAVAEKLDSGIRRIKIKIGPGHDTECIKAVRAQFPDIALMVDANNAYTPHDFDRIASWDDYELLMLEQPLDEDDLYYHSLLCQRVETPICMDESIKNLHLADCAVKMGAMDIVNIKVGRVAGLSNAKRIHDYLQSYDIPVWIGSRLGTGIGVAMRVAAASLPNCTYPADIGFSAAYLPEEITETAFGLEDGCYFTVPYNTPGLGVEVIPKLLDKYLVAEYEL